MKWENLKQASLETIVAWAESQPWCRAMADCAQDAEWHAEGDVWTHTRLVLRQLVELDEWTSLTLHEQTVLIFTALFHDVAKPLTTEVDAESGRVTSPRHAVKGEHIARAILRDLGCDLATREEIARLVRYHGRPVFLHKRNQPIREVVRLSWLVNNRLLYLFALADKRGRKSDSPTRPEDNLHFWKMVAEEANCFDQTYPFANDQARFLFYRQREPNLHYVPHEDYSCNVTLMSGLPGSGKDTWLERNRNDLPVVSFDDIRVEQGIEPTDNQGKVVQFAQKRCRQFLRQRVSFAFNATNLVRQTRQRWINLCSDYGARIELVYVEPPFSAILRQNKQRQRPVPEQVVRDLAQKCEPPTWTEAHQLILAES